MNVKKEPGPYGLSRWTAGAGIYNSPFTIRPSPKSMLGVAEALSMAQRLDHVMAQSWFCLLTPEFGSAAAREKRPGLRSAFCLLPTANAYCLPLTAYRLLFLHWPGLARPRCREVW